MFQLQHTTNTEAKYPGNLDVVFITTIELLHYISLIYEIVCVTEVERGRSGVRENERRKENREERIRGKDREKEIESRKKDEKNSREGRDRIGKM